MGCIEMSVLWLSGGISGLSAHDVFLTWISTEPFLCPIMHLEKFVHTYMQPFTLAHLQCADEINPNTYIVQ